MENLKSGAISPFIELPEKILSLIRQQYAGFFVDEVSREQNEKGGTIYRIKLERWKLNARLLFDQEGNLLDYSLQHY